MDQTLTSSTTEFVQNVEMTQTINCLKGSVDNTETTQTEHKRDEYFDKDLKLNFKNPDITQDQTGLPNNGRIKKIGKPKQRQNIGKISQIFAPVGKTFPAQNSLEILRQSIPKNHCKKSFCKNDYDFLSGKTIDGKTKSCLALNVPIFKPKQSFTHTQLAAMISCFDINSFYGRIDCNYLTQRQSEMTPKSRALLINWLFLIHQKFGFNFQTYFTAINLLDAYCSRVVVSANRFQLLGLTVLFIAAKFEEIKPPRLQKFLMISENLFTVNEVISLEAEVMIAVDFRVSTASPYQLLELLTTYYNIPSFVFGTALGFLISSCFDLRMNVFGCEKIVESCLFLAKKMHPGVADSRDDLSCQFQSDSILNSVMAGENNTTCMRYLSLIVMNLEKAGLFAIRKAFPSFQRGSESPISSIN